MKKGYVHSTESFGSVDGPGVRFIVFMQGCNMRCKYCHNPDTWKNSGGKEVTADEIIKSALRYRTYWGEKGGITISGGEPLLQIDFLIELCKKCKEQGINTVIDTAGNPFTREEPFFSKFNELLQYTDLFMLDLKHIDSKDHKSLTGFGNENILDLAEYLSEKNVPMWIRHVLVPDINDDDFSLNKLHKFIKTLKNVRRVEILPYHNLGEFKYEALGIKYPLEGLCAPTKESITNAQRLLHITEYTDFIND
ncbi:MULTISPECIES: pyruvate formate-lyase-activating protein [unclassified Ruminococcus]|uniref:pyruvate formate-lyase-activating protein n=1 Tax=unclassified Ruminococcus TaxID=2608920 RepID=UPI00210E658D|nr:MULTISPECIES: pyruvate formate-lyase-activating protein [unclassified Ruminococcus]MCQ4022673.1 pyruvate formate lyase-activating protein [Ruminococcus sp. zg-924]MCQ4114913.1 pyruvate formate lyase-activating protein [Ruminococcus sp. zg-921]